MFTIVILKVYKLTASPFLQLIEPIEAGPGEWQTISGSSLQPDTQVHYRLLEGGLNDAVAITQYINGTKMKARVPPYTATQPFNGYVYVSTKTANNSIVNDRAIAFILKPTIKPTIGSVFQMQGSPGDPVLINGTAFAQPVEVHFMMSPTGPDLKADRIAGMTDTQITTYVPEFSGVAKPVDGFVYVKVGEVKSSLFPFRMVPTTEYKPLSLTSYASSCIWFEKRNEVDNYTIDSTVSSGGKVIGIIGGHHRAKLTEGFSGVDRYFSGVILKNGWVVDNVDSGVYWGITKPGKAGASISESHVGSPNALVAVAWWNTPVDHDIWYWLQVTIRGPKGVSYK